MAVPRCRGTSSALGRRHGLDTAETRLCRLQAVIEAGADPAAINEAQLQRAAARAELDGPPEPDTLTDAEVYAMMIDSSSRSPDASSPRTRLGRGDS